MTAISRFSSITVFVSILACSGTNQPAPDPGSANPPLPDVANLIHANPDSIRTVHVMVALCDNKYQGIVPVPAGIGNGQAPASNLYWGAGYGVKSFFKKSKDWQLLTVQQNPAAHIMERLLFRHRTKHIYLLADAYDGQFIQQTTLDFLSASAGGLTTAISASGKTIYFGGASSLIAYIGHDGLMDFTLQQGFPGNNKGRQTIVLACYSKNYFAAHLKPTGASPLLWTTGLMAPEAYTLHDAVGAWANGQSAETIRMAAAAAYSRYQHCSLKASQRLLVTGW